MNSPLNEQYLNHDVSLDEQQYRDSSSVLLNLDCLAGLKLLKDESVHLCLTDPPYNLGNFMKGRNTGVFRLRENHFVASGWDDLAYEDWYVQMLDFLQLTYSKLAPNGAVIIFMSIIKVESIIEIAQKAGFYYKTTGIWHKTNPMPRNMNLTFVNSTEAWVYLIKKGPSGTFNNNGKLLHDFIETGLTPKSEKKFGKHPTQKPEKLIQHFVEVLSNPNDLIIDPFMGSGTTAVVSKKCGRRFFGTELNSEYFDSACNRVKDV